MLKHSAIQCKEKGSAAGHLICLACRSFQVQPPVKMCNPKQFEELLAIRVDSTDFNRPVV